MNYLHPSEIERLSHLSNHPFDEIRADSLTPSDYILLAEARWAPVPHAPGLRQLRRRPSLDALSRALATAFLVNEKAGNIRLQLTKSRYTPLNRFQHVEATFISWQHRWPGDSVEARLATSGKVLDLVGTLAPSDSSSVKGSITDHLLREMATRGLIKHQTEQYRALVVISRARERFLMGPRVWEALSQDPAGTAARFISISAETRPELTEELLRDIRAVLSDGSTG